MIPGAAEHPDVSDAVRRANVLLAGGYAWAATVLPVALGHGPGWAVRIAASLSLLGLLAGAVVADHPRLARALGLHAFGALGAAAWVLSGPAVAPDHLDPIRAAFGAVGWVVVAFSWGSPRHAARVPEDDPRVVVADPLPPRGGTPLLATPVLAFAVLSAAIVLALAWRETRATHALLGHAAATAAAIALVGAGAEIAVSRGRARVEPGASTRTRLVRASVSLAAAAFLLVVGALGSLVGGR